MEREAAIKNRRRISKAKKQRQKLMIMGGAGITLLILIIVAILVFGSCGTDYAKAETNTVYLLKNGKVISTDIEAFNEKDYDKDKLQAYVKDVIDTYNSKNGKDSVKEKTFKVEENTATLVLEYADAEVYEKVNGVEIFAGTIEEAKKAGYEFDVSFAKMEDGKAVVANADEFGKGIDYKVLIIKSNTKVVLPGKVCYVSTQNISKVGEDYVVIKDGCQLLAEENVLNTEFGTEAEGSDESIGEGEVEGGDGEIIFDFGDEAETGSQYSEVLTYIIYK